MALLDRTCYRFSLKCGAITTFTYATVVSLYRLLSIPKVMVRVSFFLDLSDTLIAGCTGILAIVGSINNHPDLILPFITYYVGLLSIDLISVMGTISYGRPLYAHNVVRGFKLKKKLPYSATPWIVATILFTTVLLLRLYFTAIVFSFYKQLKSSQIRESEEAAIAGSAPPTTAPPTTASHSLQSIHDQIE